MFDNNFDKCGPIFNFFHQVIRKEILYVHITKIYTLPCNMLLHYLVKVKNQIMLTLTARFVDMLL